MVTNKLPCRTILICLIACLFFSGCAKTGKVTSDTQSDTPLDQFALARYNPEDGSLDPSFGGDGKVLAGASGFVAPSEVRDIAIDGSGRIVAAGFLRYGPSTGPYTKVFALRRFNINGSLDISFGSEGLAVVGFAPSTSEVATSVVIDANDRIVVGGYAIIDGGAQFALARLKPDGTLDPTFGDDGKVLTNLTGSTSERINAIVIDHLNRIVVAGFATVEGGMRFALAAYIPAGDLASNFAGDGIKITDIPKSTDEEANDIVSLTGGGFGMKVPVLIAAGTARFGSNSVFVLIHYDENGEEINVEYKDYKSPFTVTDFDGSTSQGANAIIDYPFYRTGIGWFGGWVVGGYAIVGGSYQFALAKYTDANIRTGMDPDFGEEGKVLTDFTSSSGESVNDIVKDANGKIVAAGAAIVQGKARFAVARYLSDGNLDYTFDNDGKVLTNFTSTVNEKAYAVAIDPKSGKIIVGGCAGVCGDPVE